MDTIKAATVFFSNPYILTNHNEFIDNLLFISTVNVTFKITYYYFLALFKKAEILYRVGRPYSSIHFF